MNVHIVVVGSKPLKAFAEEKDAIEYRDWLRNARPSSMRIYIKEMKLNYGQIR